MQAAKDSISVVIPCYNGARYLQETLESAVGQTHPPLEVIVVDDGSTDNSAAIAESFGPSVRVIQQNNQGESVARNRGIAEARGDYLHFLDADDLLHSEAFQRLCKVMGGRNDAVAVMGCAWFETDPDSPFASSLPETSDFFPHILQSNLAPLHCCLVPRNVVQRLGGFCESIQQFEDWDLWAQVALTGAELVTVDFIGAYYRRHRQCQSETSPKVERVRGHAAVMRRLSDGVLARETLLESYGSEMFWSAWAAYHRGRLLGVTDELRPLARNIEQIARKGPIGLRRTRFARMVRMLGLPTADRLRGAIVSASGT